MTFFAADNHWDHANIIKYCDRPFETVDEMNWAMVEKWNKIVGKNDTVHHLADFTLSDCASRYFEQLNGIINILRVDFHHDKRWIRKEWSYVHSRSAHVHLAPPLVLIEHLDGFPPICLSHFPLAQWPRKHYGAWHLHGHSHGNYKGEGKILDVGVDCWDFYPVSLEQVAEAMEDL